MDIRKKKWADSISTTSPLSEKGKKNEKKKWKKTQRQLWRIAMIVIHRLKKLVCQELFLIL